jgi:hypothetical protein
MLTPLQTVIEKLEEWYEYHERRGDELSREDYNELIKFTTKLLEKERDVVKKAYGDGHTDGLLNLVCDPSSYYHKQFK